VTVTNAHYLRTPSIRPRMVYEIMMHIIVLTFDMHSAVKEAMGKRNH